MTALVPLLKSIDGMFPISLKKERLRIRNPKELLLLFQEVCRVSHLFFLVSCLSIFLTCLIASHSFLSFSLDDEISSW
jgi:hypothetical protein